MSRKVSMDIGPDKLGDLLGKARDAYRAWHGSQVWLVHPSTCKGTSDCRDLYKDGIELDQAVTAIGGYLLEQLELPSEFIRDRTDFALGSAFFENHYADLIGRLRNTLDWFREGEWDKLYDEGSLVDEEYQELTRNREIAVPLS